GRSLAHEACPSPPAPPPPAPARSRRSAPCFRLGPLLGEEPLLEAPALTVELEGDGIVERRQPRGLAQRRLAPACQRAGAVGGARCGARRLVQQVGVLDARPRQADPRRSGALG